MICFVLFLWFYNGFGQFLVVFIGFTYGFALFWVAPFGFSLVFGSRNGFERKIKGKLSENQSQPTPEPLRSFLLGLSLLCLFSFKRNGEGRILSGPLWTCSGPLLSLFLLLSLLWGSFSGTSPESLLVVWPPLGSSGWLWPPPSSLCLLLRVIRKKSDSGASLELPSGHLPPLSSLGSSGWLWPSPSSLCLL